MGAVLPRKVFQPIISTAKDAIDNGGAGRAAKGENPSLCAIKTHTKGALKLYRVCLFLCLLFVLRGFYNPFSF